MLRVLLYENYGGLRRLTARIWRSRLMRHQGVSPQTDPGRLVTTERPWAESMKAYPGMTVARRRTVRWPCS